MNKQCLNCHRLHTVNMSEQLIQYIIALSKFGQKTSACAWQSSAPSPVGKVLWWWVENWDDFLYHVTLSSDLICMWCTVVGTLFDSDVYCIYISGTSYIYNIHCGSKNRTPVIFSNYFNKYWSISTILVHIINNELPVFTCVTYEFLWNRVPA